MGIHFKVSFSCIFLGFGITWLIEILLLLQLQQRECVAGAIFVSPGEQHRHRNRDRNQQNQRQLYLNRPSAVSHHSDSIVSTSTVNPIAVLEKAKPGNTKNTDPEAPPKDEPRFMMGMLSGMENKWSFKTPGFFGAQNSNSDSSSDGESDTVNSKLEAQDSFFCRLSKRQSLIMFSFCMEENDDQQATKKAKVSAKKEVERHQNHQVKRSKIKSNGVTGKWRQSGSEYSTVGYGHRPSSSDKLTKASIIKKNKKQQREGQQQDQHFGTDIKVQGQLHVGGQAVKNVAVPMPLDVGVRKTDQNRNQNSNQNPSWEAEVQNDTEIDDEDQEQETDTRQESSSMMPMMPMMTSSTSKPSLIPSLLKKISGKPKIVIKSDASIQILYELSLDQLKLAKERGQLDQVEKMKSGHLENILQQHFPDKKIQVVGNPEIVHIYNSEGDDGQ